MTKNEVWAAKEITPGSPLISQLTWEEQQHLNLPVVYGWSEEADYREPLIPSYRHNPLIEALPPILGQEEAAWNLAYYPEFDEQQRQLSAELRFHLVQEAMDFFEPLAIHLDLEQRFSRMIRSGYKARNPLRRTDWQDIDNKVAALTNASNRPLTYSTATGFTLLGLSGVGKSTAIERILTLYPQVIFHQHYQNQPLSLTQLVWLKLDCPFDGSIKGLCLNFFEAIDSRLGTTYYKYYAKNGSHVTVDTLLPRMARLGSIHRLGVLVVDEIQNLSQAKSGGSARMLNFFVQLVNTIGMPVVLIGTPKARHILTKEFRQARRSTGQGDPVWNNMPEDEVWQLFLESLWRYQYVRQPCDLTPELSHTLHDETQGIIDFAVKIFMLAQIRAIVSGQESLTPTIIRSVAAESLRLAAPALAALRKGDRYALQQFEDLYPLELETCLEQARIELQNNVSSELQSTLTAPATGNQPEATAEVEIEPQHLVSAIPKSNHAEPELISSKNDICQIAAQGLKQDIAAYQALQGARLIRPATEYLREGV